MISMLACECGGKPAPGAISSSFQIRSAPQPRGARSSGLPREKCRLAFSQPMSSPHSSCKGLCSIICALPAVSSGTAGIQRARGRSRKWAEPRAGASTYLPCVFIGVDERSGGKGGRPYDRLSRRIPEVREVVASDVSVLDLKDTRLGPTAAGSKLQVAQNRLKCVIARELRDLRIVQGAGCRDRLLDDLHLSVSLRRHIVAKRVCAFGGRARLVLRNHLADTRVHHLRDRQPVLVIDQTVQERAEFRLDRTVLRPNHRAADEFRFKPDLVDGPEKSRGIVEVRAEKQNIDAARLELRDKRHEVRRGKRISFFR